ncbi:hypothetical protein [Mycolicibacterium sp.]|uniref:hypothetical protein n=1 Tax=Mycolicibacterium sp. TaxID=2320850 RepID=UPI003D0E76B4
MKNFTIATAAAAGLTAAVLGLAAPAAAAPTAGGNAADTISALEAQGNRVIVNRLSDKPLSEATVVGVNRGSDIRSTVQDHRYDRTFQQTVTGQVVYVDVR